MDIETISTLADVGNIFESTGFSIIRITTAGVSRNLKIPIRTKGVDDLKFELAKKAPRPPITRETIKADSPEGVELGIETDQEKMVFDFTNKDYVEAQINHGKEVIWRSVIQGLNFTWPDGCDEFEKRKALLLEKGFTDAHLGKIYFDIRKLVTFQEDKEDFLPESSQASQKK